MPTPVEWCDEAQTIIKLTITKESIWDEYYEAIKQIVSEASKVDHIVYIIIHDDVGLPKGNPLPHLKWGSQKIVSIPNAGQTYIAGTQGNNNTLVQLILGSIGKLLMGRLPTDEDKQLIYTRTLEDAIERIRKEQTKGRDQLEAVRNF